MSNNLPSVSVDFGIAAFTIEGAPDDSLSDVMEEFGGFVESETLEEAIRELKSMDHEIEAEYDVDTGSAPGSDTTFR
jgi:hypothetical protein